MTISERSMNRTVGIKSDPSKKPVYLTKAQREQIALQDEIADQKRCHEHLQVKYNRPSSDNHYCEKNRKRDRDRNSDRDREKESNRVRLKNPAEKELEAIHEQYLGSKKPKKRVITSGAKLRSSFDWQSSEDTSRDVNPLYQNPHEARPHFGRGFFGGIDRREQKKLAIKNEREMQEEIWKKGGVKATAVEAAALKKKEQNADLYDTFDMLLLMHHKRTTCLTGQNLGKHWIMHEKCGFRCLI